jgi:hypothetical protein
LIVNCPIDYSLRSLAILTVDYLHGEFLCERRTSTARTGRLDRRVNQERDMPMSGATWVAVVAGIVTVVAIVRAVRTKANARRLDVGAVSNQ